MANPLVENLRVDRRSLDLYAVPEIPALDPDARRALPQLGAMHDRLARWREEFNSGLRDKLLALTDLGRIKQDIDGVTLLTKEVDGRSVARDRKQDEEIVATDSRVTNAENKIRLLELTLNDLRSYITNVENTALSDTGWFLFTAAAPVNPWNITHTLNRFVAVTLFDTSGNQILGHVNQPDTSTVVVTFSGSLAGTALLS